MYSEKPQNCLPIVFYCEKYTDYDHLPPYKYPYTELYEQAGQNTLLYI